MGTIVKLSGYANVSVRQDEDIASGSHSMGISKPSNSAVLGIDFLSTALDAGLQHRLTRIAWKRYSGP